MNKYDRYDKKTRAKTVKRGKRNLPFWAYFGELEKK